MAPDDEDQEEESFFVSMTDIMVGLLFIFLLIIMYFAVQSKIDQKTIMEGRKEITSLTKFLEKNGDLKNYSELTLYQEAVTLQRDFVLNWIRAHLISKGVTGVEIIEEQGVIRLPEGILFASGEFAFTKGSRAESTAKAVASALNIILPCSVLNKNGRPYTSREKCQKAFYHNKNMGFVQAIYVEGHTDSSQIRRGLRGDQKLTTNLKLSARRSTNTFEAVVMDAPRILEFHGPVVGESELRFEPILASSSYGEWRPIRSNDTDQGRRYNRRIDLRVVMYVPPNIDAMKRLANAVGATLKKEDGR